MLILALKLLLSPGLLAVATLASRRWGNTVGGWIGGLPLTSGPLSLVLFLSEGGRFASSAATGTLLGLLTVAIFALLYSHAAVRCRWPAALGIASLGFCASAVVALNIEAAGYQAAALALVVLALCFLGLPRGQATAKRASSRGSDLILRMLIAVLIILTLSGAAAYLGATLTGLLAAAPVFAGILAVFAHAQEDGLAAVNILRGVLLGGVSFVLFFSVIGACAETLGGLSYALATVIALIGNVPLVLLGQAGAGCEKLVPPPAASGR